MTRGNIVLGFLDHLALELLDPPALDADKMVMVLLLDLVTRDPVIESTFGCKTGFDEQFHRSIHRCVPDVRVLLAYAFVEVFARDVTLRLEERREDQLTLFRVLEMVLLEVRSKGFHLDFVRHDGTISLPSGTFLLDSGETPTRGVPQPWRRDHHQNPRTGFESVA